LGEHACPQLRHLCHEPHTVSLLACRSFGIDRNTSALSLRRAARGGPEGCKHRILSSRAAAYLPVVARVTSGRIWQHFLDDETEPTSTDGATLDGRIPTPCQGDHEGSYAGEGAGLSTATGGYRGSSRSGSADRGADARGVIWALCAPRRKLKEPPKKSLSSGQIPDRLACRTWESPPSDTL
jgi:hypothetical protein